MRERVAVHGGTVEAPRYRAEGVELAGLIPPDARAEVLAQLAAASAGALDVTVSGTRTVDMPQ